MSQISVNLDLVRKYNVSGPRYTSYPPAPHFRAIEDTGSFLKQIRQTAKTDRGLSLYFHLPFCQTLCWYCGCHTVITKKQSQSARYIEYLEKELDFTSRLIPSNREVVQLHFGGGTPTFLLPDEIRQLGAAIRKRFPLASDIEAGVEIDPRRLSRDHITALRDAGFNRASLGIQDHNPVVQKAVNRIQPKEQTEEVVSWIREAGFQSLSVDLIYGLPYQTVETFSKTLDEVIALSPDRLAVFSYAHVPWIKPAQNILEKEAALPSPETKLQLLKLSVEKLTANGWVYIGMDHFAKHDDELAVAQRNKTLQRNFQGYSTRGGTDICGFGVSSISQSEDLYWQNQKDLTKYYAEIDLGNCPVLNGYVLTPDDKIRRTTIMRLMCDMGLDYRSMSGSLGVDFQEYYRNELASLNDLEEEGFLERTAEGLTVTSTGRLFIRNIAMRFDAYLGRGTVGVYSKTI